MKNVALCSGSSCHRKGQLVRIVAMGLCYSCYITGRSYTQRGLCARCKKVKLAVKKFKFTQEILCKTCKGYREYELFLKNILPWSAKSMHCVLCESTEFRHSRHGICMACDHLITKLQFCDRCQQRMGRNFCRRPIRDNNKSYSRLCIHCAEHFNYPWAFGHRVCVSCGENDRPHKRRGLCDMCSQALTACGFRTCMWCGNVKTLRSFTSAGIPICSWSCLSQYQQDVGGKFRSGTNIKTLASEYGTGFRFITTTLRKAGLYTRKYVAEHFGSISIIVKKADISGELQYFTEEKERIREQMAKETAKLLTAPIKLVTLPHVNMADIAMFVKMCGIDPQKSLAVEKELKWFNMLTSWVQAAHRLPDGNTIAGLRLYHGQLSQALADVTGSYTCANFDFDGCVSKEVRASLFNLFSHRRLCDDALLFITVSDALRFQARRYIGEPQSILLPRVVNEIAKSHGFHSESLWDKGIRYKERSRSPMLTLALRIHKDKRNGSLSLI